MMVEFWWIASVLIVIALSFIVVPLWRNRQLTAREQLRRDSNIELYQDRLQEIDSESQWANYDQQEVERLKRDLQHRLLDDVEPEPETVPLTSLQKTSALPLLALGLCLLLPLAAVLLYFRLGASADLAIVTQLENIRSAANGAEAAEKSMLLTQQLEQRLQAEPNNLQYLMLLSRADMQLQRYFEASLTLEKIMRLVDDDPQVMGLYAQARYLAAGRKMDQQTLAIARRALELQPFNGTVLGMMGMVSFEQADYENAVNYWQRLLRILDPQSDTAKMIQRGIEQANQALATVPVKQATQDPNSEPSVTPEYTVTVTVDNAISYDKNDSVFVYARAVNGPKMPLAVVKLLASQLPTTVVLNDSMAMAAGLNLSSFSEVEIIARISKRGMANSGSGDLEGRSKPLTVGGRQALVLEINSKIP